MENFRSIKDEVTLSLVAGPGTELEQTNITDISDSERAKKLRLLRSAVLYGPNASGKSNLIQALDTMERIIRTSGHELDELPITPFRLSASTLDQPSVFEVTFLIDHVRYQYGFSATSKAICEEWLYAFPKGRPQTWFKRTYKGGQEYYAFSDKLAGDRKSWQRATRPNALFLSTAIQLNSKQLRPIYDWFVQKLYVFKGVKFRPDASIRLCLDNGKEHILDFLQAADFAIDNIRVEEKEPPLKSFPADMPASLRRILEKRKWHRLITSHRSDFGKAVEFDLSDESDGTQKMFNLAACWLDAMDEGRILVVDELNNSLHPKLVHFLIKLFHNHDTNPHSAQLLFSTHETALLSQDVFRRDQIWFCERTPEQSTSLFPLSDFSPRKKVENLERAYLAGRYDALPLLDLSKMVNRSLDGKKA